MVVIILASVKLMHRDVVRVVILYCLLVPTRMVVLGPFDHTPSFQCSTERNESANVINCTSFRDSALISSLRYRRILLVNNARFRRLDSWGPPATETERQNEVDVLVLVLVLIFGLELRGTLVDAQEQSAHLPSSCLNLSNWNYLFDK